MAENQPDRAETQEPVDRPQGRGLPWKTALIVLLAFVLQVGVVFLVFNLYRQPPVTAAAQPAGGEDQPPPCDRLAIIDLGTFNVTQFQKGDPLNRRQLAVSIALAIDKQKADTNRNRILEQKPWIGQLIDEVIGPLPMDAIHSTNREPLKRQLRARINQRLGGNVVEEVILRIQAFGP